MPIYESCGRWRYRFTFRNHRYSGTTLKTQSTKKHAEALEAAHYQRVVARPGHPDLLTLHIHRGAVDVHRAPQQLTLIRKARARLDALAREVRRRRRSAR